MKKTHWKKLTNPNYLGSWDFEEKEERTVVIKNVKKEIVTNHEGKKEEVVLMEIVNSLPIILNKTNLKATEKACDTPIIEDWIGKEIVIYVEEVKAFGQLVDALRISLTAPQPKVKPNLNKERFLKAIEAIKSGDFTIEGLQEKYKLTEEQNNQLNKIK